jgi:hypothetical protein
VHYVGHFTISFQNTLSLQHKQIPDFFYIASTMKPHIYVKAKKHSDVNFEKFIFPNNLEFFSIVASNWKVPGNVSFLPVVVRIIDGSDDWRSEKRRTILCAIVYMIIKVTRLCAFAYLLFFESTLASSNRY